MIGIENIKKCVGAAADLGSLVSKVVEGGLSLSDLRYLPDAFEVISLLFGTSYSELSNELADLSLQEKEELAALFSERFDLPSDSLESAIEAGVKLLLEVVARILDLKLAALAVNSKLKK